MSLRLASLDPNEPRAAKDCRNCNRRRIKCDRGIPTCKKCEIRSLDCPGYGLRIRWEGVASRGKLSGMKIPVLGGEPTAPLTKVLAPPRGETSAQTTPLPARIDIHSLLSGSAPSHPEIQHNANAIKLDNPHALNLDLTAHSLPSPLHDPAAQHLLKYYDHVISATFPWVEGPDNHWRTVMLPLALECRSLLLALLAMAAEQYASTTGQQWVFGDGTRGSSALRDECLRLLADNVREELADVDHYEQRYHSSGLLATILALCNLEMVRADSDLWRMHWSAARAITRRWTSPPRSVTTLGFDDRFLVVDAFTYDAFASCTRFDGNQQISNDAIHPDDVDIFIEYFRHVQDVTRLERSRFEGVPKYAAPLWLRNREAIMTAFDAIRERNLGFDQLFQLASKERKEDFKALIDMYHFSATLYAAQVALESATDLPLRLHCAEAVIDCLNQIRSPEGIQQNFVWPLFIVATEARGMHEAQMFVERHLLDAMSSTGWSNCLPALEFLRRFWKTTPGLHPTWITFAREESARGIKFLVI